MSDYPKIMTRGGLEISVGGEAEEAEKRADGWCSPLDGPLEGVDAGAVLSTSADADPSDTVPVESTFNRGVGYDDEPTFGPPHDQTHAKRKGAGKKR